MADAPKRRFYVRCHGADNANTMYSNDEGWAEDLEGAFEWVREVFARPVVGDSTDITQVVISRRRPGPG